MSSDSKSIRLVTALVECRPDGEYVPWGIKWYDGAVYPFKEIESYTPRSWAMGNDHVCESWRVVLKNDTAREICHYKNSWYVVHDPQDDQPGIAPPKRAPSVLHTLPELAFFTWRCFFSHCTEVRYSMPSFQSWRLTSKPSGMSHSRYART